MYRRILVPLDGSRRAERVIPHVIELARVGNARPVLLRVIEPPAGAAIAAGPVVGSIPIAMINETQQQARKEASEYLNSLKADLDGKQGIECVAMIERGGVVRQIAEVAERLDVDLIVLTSHGRTALATAIFGSVALGVLHQVDRPILLVRSSKC